MNERSPIPRTLTIAGSDSGGAAGIQADLKTFTALRAYGMSAITALTAQNTQAVRSVLPVPASFVRAQIDAVAEDVGIDAAKTGMLANASIIRAVAEAVHAHRIAPLVVDPVMVAQSGGSLLDADAVSTLRERLLPLAAVVTPNVPEASVLLDRVIESVADMRDAARRLVELGSAAVLLKGGHLAGADAIDILHDGRDLHELCAPRIATAHTHGTGCMLSAALAVFLAEGLSTLDAATRAKQFISVAIADGLPIGKGNGPANPLAWLHGKEPGSDS
jgi:hydroxymethylpyrimidine/phosphomethylpyrimidine kinase